MEAPPPPQISNPSPPPPPRIYAEDLKKGKKRRGSSNETSLDTKKEKTGTIYEFGIPITKFCWRIDNFFRKTKNKIFGQIAYFEATEKNLFLYLNIQEKTDEMLRKTYFL